MRKLNSILSVALIAILLIHAVLGSLKMLGAGGSAGKILGWISVCILVAHAFIGIILSVQSIKARKENGKGYVKKNILFWIRRASGIAIAVLIFFHIGSFGTMRNGLYVIYKFTPFRMTMLLMLAVALFVHIFSNVTPLLLSWGVSKKKKWKILIYIILVLILLLIVGACIYYFVSR